MSCEEDTVLSADPDAASGKPCRPTPSLDSRMDHVESIKEGKHEIQTAISASQKEQQQLQQQLQQQQQLLLSLLLQQQRHQQQQPLQQQGNQQQQPLQHQEYRQQEPLQWQAKMNAYSTAVPLWQLEFFTKSASFHGTMSRREAELALDNHGSGRCYLTRFCPEENHTMLSIMTTCEETANKHDHFVLIVEKNELNEEVVSLDGINLQFNSVVDLLEFYENNPVNFEVSNIGVEVQNAGLARNSASKDGLGHSLGVPLWKIEDLMNSPSFHGTMTEEEAEKKLENHSSDKCYITRFDAARKLCFLTVKHGKNKYSNFVVNITEDEKKTQFDLKGTVKKFEKISDLLLFYEKNPVNFDLHKIGHAVQSEHYKSTTGMDLAEESIRQGSGCPLWIIEGITKSPSFHGAMTAREAELLLEQHGSVKCYLTRYDVAEKVCYLTVKTGRVNGNLHFIIEMTTGDENEITYELAGTEKQFDQIAALLTFFENNPINFEVRSIGVAFHCGSHEQIAGPDKEFDGTGDQPVKQSYGVSWWKAEDIMKHHSFHGILTGKAAEMILEKNGEKNCYLTRYDASREACFLSVQTGRKIHFEINIVRYWNRTWYELKGTSKVFEKISDLLSFYEKNPINFEVSRIGKVIHSEIICEQDRLGQTEDQEDSIVPSSGLFLWIIEDVMKSPSFHGIMSGKKAEETLKKRKSNKCYLTCYDKAKALCFLTVKSERKFYHFAIETKMVEHNVQHELSGTGRVFPKISALLKFYEGNPINFEVNGIGEMVQSENYEHVAASDLEKEFEDTTKVEKLEIHKSQEMNSRGYSTWKIKHIMLNPSFHRVISRDEAELRLKNHHSYPCYLTRYDAAANIFYLCVMTMNRDDKGELEFASFHHFVLNIRRKRPAGYTPESYAYDQKIEDETTAEPEYELEGTQMVFDRVSELLSFYKKIPINFEVCSIGVEVPSGYPILMSDASQVHSAVRKRVKYDPQVQHTPPSLPWSGTSNCTSGYFADEEYDTTTSQMYTGSESFTPQKAEPTWKIKGIMEHPSYHGAMTGAGAEEKLEEYGGNYYLTRFSIARNAYSLSVAKNGKCSHFDVIITSDGNINEYEIDGTEMQSKDIFSLLNYYRSNPLSHSIDGIGNYFGGEDSVEKQDTNLPSRLTEVYRKKVKINEVVGRESSHNDLHFPNLANLSLITYTTVEGRSETVRIIAQLDSQWYDLGLLLGQSTDELDTYKVMSLTTPSKHPCCQRVFSEWLKNAGISKYPAIWAGVYDLLRDMERAGLATKLQEALKTKNIDI